MYSAHIIRVRRLFTLTGAWRDFLRIMDHGPARAQVVTSHGLFRIKA